MLIVAAALLVGCGGGDEPRKGGAALTGADLTTGPGTQGSSTAAPRPRPARCPGEVPDCRSATGRILYVERVDPDGDGDAHFVIADPQGITHRGLTFIDVRKDLRPRPLPGPGEWISAAGPVQTGSFGQSQIHALVLNVGELEK